MAKRFQKFTGKRWTDINRKDWKDTKSWDAAIAAKQPIRIVHPNGGFKVIKFLENLPDGKKFGKSGSPAEATA
ncbi:MAG: hypothetical protein VW577_06840 [Pelagibacteraceae bacterium]